MSIQAKPLVRSLIMESFQLPVTAIVALAVSLSALAFTASDPEMWLIHPSANNDRDMAITTQCDRLVLRYLLSDKSSFDSLASATRKFIGKEPYGMLLNSTEQAFSHDSRIPKDKFYLLRGKIFLKLGRDAEAKESFTAALRWNSDNSQARRNLIDLFVRTGSYSMAASEISKALAINPGDDEAGHYRQILEKIKLSYSSLNI